MLSREQIKKLKADFKKKFDKPPRIPKGVDPALTTLRDDIVAAARSLLEAIKSNDTANINRHLATLKKLRQDAEYGLRGQNKEGPVRDTYSELGGYAHSFVNSIETALQVAQPAVKKQVQSPPIQIQLMGEFGVGKTRALLKMQDPTRDIDNVTLSSDTSVTVKSGQQSLVIYDAPPYKREGGQPSYPAKQDPVVFLMYDITSKASLDGLKALRTEAERHMENPIYILVGTKNDLTAQRTVASEDVDRFAEQIGAHHIEISAKTGRNIDRLLEVASKLAIRAGEGQSMEAQQLEADILKIVAAAQAEAARPSPAVSQAPQPSRAPQPSPPSPRSSRAPQLPSTAPQISPAPPPVSSPQSRERKPSPAERSERSESPLPRPSASTTARIARRGATRGLKVDLQTPHPSEAENTASASAPTFTTRVREQSQAQSDAPIDINWLVSKAKEQLEKMKKAKPTQKNFNLIGVEGILMSIQKLPERVAQNSSDPTFLSESLRRFQESLEKRKSEIEQEKDPIVKACLTSVSEEMLAAIKAVQAAKPAEKSQPAAKSDDEDKNMPTC